MAVARVAFAFAVLAVLGSAATDLGRARRAVPPPAVAVPYFAQEDEKALASVAPELPPAADSPTIDSPAVCPPDMVEINGDYCPVVEQICEDFISESRDRCAKYRDHARCIGTPKPEHYCIDRYEYPNQRGEKPAVAMTWDEARDLCAADGKRLCAAEEWTLACEGPNHLPYPYGNVRDSEACNFDKPYIVPNDAAFRNPATRDAEIERIDQSEPSGSRERCASEYGVYDMTGNVDEWVINDHGSVEGPEFQSGLKGGYWGPVRNRCRPMTTDHNHWHSGYQIGFRCCKDTTDSAPSAPENQGLRPGVDNPASSVEMPPASALPRRS